MSMAAGGSSSLITLKKIKYDVFISFRGEDTRTNFTSHLHSALSREKIKAFIDENDLKIGDEISPMLLKAIEDSKLCLIILSEDYASSRWCLEELEYILQCKKTDGQSEVLPVFYNVKPSDVKKQEGSYAVAFAKLEERFEDEKLQAWRDALRKIAYLSGWTSKSFRSEAKLVDTVVDAVIKKLRDISTPKDDLKGLVGVITRIEKIESLLHIGSLNVGPVGIWGIGGIGKTTLARAVFSRLSSQFEACSFLENVREQWLRADGPNLLKNKLFSELMEGETFVPFTKGRLRGKRVLVVFDDVDDAEQFEQLVGDWFGPESKIIVTSRDQQVLRNIEVSGTYEIEELNHDNALKLFSLQAFKKKSPTEKERELSKRAVNYAGGVPLALIVLGRHLYSKSIKEWESTLDKLQKIPDKKIHNVLKISYDSLDDTEKDIFLDIACFFKGKSKDCVEGILDGCGFFAVAGIKVLIDKALITIDMWNTLHMHDLLQMMAFEIVNVQSTDQEPRKGSRLWIADDIYHTFKYNRGIDTIEGISLDTSKLNEEISLTPETFSQMCKLRLLMINGRKVSLPQGPLPFPNSLRYLKWDAYPLKSLSKDFTAKNLVELDMPRSKLKQLWDGVVHLENLKSINLKGSRHLLRVPDLSMAPNIESVYLDFCENLVETPSSFQYLNKLEDLSFTGCSSLCKLSGLPKNLGSLRVYTPSLEHKSYNVPTCLSCEGHISSSTRAYPQLPHFDWGPDCDHADIEISSKLEKFPEIMKTMECLKRLELVCVAIKELPHSIKNLTGLRLLTLEFCPNLEFLTESIANLNALKVLSVYYCSKLTSLPTLPPSLTRVYACHLPSLKTVSSAITLVNQNLDDLYDELGNDQKFAVLEEEFVFIGCPKLDDNTRKVLEDDARVRVFRPILCSREESLVNCKIFLPGSEIPRWFMHKSEGSSICVNFPHPTYESHNNIYLGLALCVVLNLGTPYWNHFDLPKVYYRCDYTYPNGDKMSDTKVSVCDHILPRMWYYFTECCSQVGAENTRLIFVDVENSEYMFIFIEPSPSKFYGQRGSRQRRWLDPTKISFSTSDRRIEVKRCGVHLLYSQEAERFGFNFDGIEDNEVGDEFQSSGSEASHSKKKKKKKTIIT